MDLRKVFSLFSIQQEASPLEPDMFSKNAQIGEDYRWTSICYHLKSKFKI